MINVLSFKKFCIPNFLDRIRISRSIERNYKDSLNFSYKPEGSDWPRTNFPIKYDHTLFFSGLYERYLKICRQHLGKFHLSHENRTTCWCYRSNRKFSESFWHHHFDTSTINGVYYYQIEGRDGILFKDEDDNEEKYIPEQGELIVFPSYLRHMPLPPISLKNRYSINMEIQTYEPSVQLFNNGFS